MYDIDLYYRAANAKSIGKEIKIDWMTQTSWHCNQNESIVIHLMTVSSHQICFQSQFTASSLFYSYIFVLVFVWSTLVLYGAHIFDNTVSSVWKKLLKLLGGLFCFIPCCPPTTREKNPRNDFDIMFTYWISLHQKCFKL